VARGPRHRGRHRHPGPRVLPQVDPASRPPRHGLVAIGLLHLRPAHPYRADPRTPRHLRQPSRATRDETRTRWCRRFRTAQADAAGTRRTFRHPFSKEPGETRRDTVSDPVSAAKQQAKKQNKRVEIASLRGETSTTYANPDGKTLHSEVHSGPIRVRKDGVWQPIDTTLVEKDGLIRPKAIKGDLSFSAGGGTTLAKVKNAKGEAKILAPAKLPKPVLEHNTATYPSAYGKGVDLVISATPTGFRQDIVIRQRPTGKLKLKVPVGLPKGMTYGKDTAGKPALQLAPDPGFLADPTVTYPVTLAVPSQDWTGTGIASDTFVSQSYPSSAANYTLNRILVGKSNSGTVTWRGYVRFNIQDTPLMGGTVTNADLRMYNYRSNLCQYDIEPGIVARRVTSDWDATEMTWNDQPSFDYTGQDINTGAYTDDCDRGEGELYYSIEQITQSWMDGEPDYGVRLSSASEYENTNWRWYRSADDRLR
jgi:hypothetical protein